MIFARGMPSLTPELRLKRLPALNFDAVKLSPSEALEKAQFDGIPSRATLLNKDAVVGKHGDGASAAETVCRAAHDREERCAGWSAVKLRFFEGFRWAELDGAEIQWR